jgi:hypothetical protein
MRLLQIADCKLPIAACPLSIEECGLAFAAINHQSAIVVGQPQSAICNLQSAITECRVLQNTHCNSLKRNVGLLASNSVHFTGSARFCSGRPIMLCFAAFRCEERLSEAAYEAKTAVSGSISGQIGGPCL